MDVKLLTNATLPFERTPRYVVQFPPASSADDRDKRDMTDTSYSHMPPPQTFVFAACHVIGLGDLLVFVEMSVAFFVITK